MGDVTPLTQDEIDSAEFDDLGMIDLPDMPDPDAPPSAPRSPFLEDTRAGAPPPPEAPPEPDEPPAHARKRRRKTPDTGTPVKRARIAVGIRADINAKVSMPLEVGGTNQPVTASLREAPGISSAAGCSFSSGPRSRMR